MFLTPDELVTLTGYSQRSAQIRVLGARGIPHWVNAKGRPVVLQNWDAPRAEPVEQRLPFVRPTLDREAAFRPLDEIRARREPYRWNMGPSGSGVYFLFLRWALVYVGQSKYLGFPE